MPNDESMAWEYTRKEEERMARDDAIIARWIAEEIADHVHDMRSAHGVEVTAEDVDEVTREVTRQARQYREQIINDWESSK